MPKAAHKRGKDLTPAERAEIIGMHKAGMGYSIIAKEVKRTKGTVEKTIKRFGSRNTLISKKSRGKTTKMTSVNLKRLETYIKRHPYSTPKEISELSWVTVGSRQIYNIRRKLGFIPDSGKKEIELTSKQKQDRLQWAREHLHDSFENAIFGDEKPFVIGRVRRKGYRKASQPRLKKLAKKYPERLSIFAAIGMKGRTQVTVWKGRQDSKEYQDTLQRSLLPLIRNQYPISHRYFHDKDSTHTSKATKHWLGSKRIQHHFLPSNSPQLNPIEFLWWILESRVDSRHPTTYEETRDVIFEEWDKITQKEINTCIQDMKNSLPLIIEAKGGNITRARHH